jgi:hypothetical protein
MYNRAVLLEREGLLVEAEEAQRKCLQLRQRVLGQVVMVVLVIMIMTMVVVLVIMIMTMVVVLVIMIMTMTRAWAGPHADAAERSGARQFSSSWGGCGGR